ncbi:MAG: hypothetical protein CBC24_07600 [Candidatus Pelagibacter sp. TMED64]|mgnify:CR=1 FL=1|nr:MAG: hypothetical protein CBC24_07600 [Candidatus Pelagibacter sp. TMED64]
MFGVKMVGISYDFQLLGNKWGQDQGVGTPGEIVTYSFASDNYMQQFGFFDAFIVNPVFQNEITDALAEWENTADIRFVLVPDSSDVGIRFGWSIFDGPLGTLGRTTVPAEGPLRGVTVAFDVNEDWFVLGNAPEDEIDFSYTALHEIGHAIGLDHSSDPNAVLAETYSGIPKPLQDDDIQAIETLYGANSIPKIELNRFFNTEVGGHFFTPDIVERESVENIKSFRSEGVVFQVMPRTAEDIIGSVAVYRFLNIELGSHLLTAFSGEMQVLQASDNFLFEGESFRAFENQSSSTIPVYRFFNLEQGGHLFTTDGPEKNTLMQNSLFRFEGEAFYAFPEMIL